MTLIVGSLYEVVIEEYSYDDELLYFTEPNQVYNYCICPGNLYDYKHTKYYMTNYSNVFMYIGTTRFKSLHNDEEYDFHKFLFGAQIIYFRYKTKYIKVK